MSTWPSLAADLGLSPATIASTYRDLRIRGIARGYRRAGTRITGAPPTAPRPPLVVPPGVRDLVAGSPDPALSPALAREAAARFRADGIDPAHLAVVGAALDGTERVVRAWLRPRDLMAVEDPGYPPLLDLLSAMDITALPVGLDELGMQPGSLAEALARGCSGVVFVPRAQSSTGAAWDPSRAADIAAVLARHPDVLVVEDDHAADVAGAPALTVTGGRSRWVTIRSASKSLSPDLRLAVLAGDAVTIARVEGRQALGTGWVSYLLQEAVAALWRDPAVEALLAQATAAYAHRREILIGELAERGIAACGRSGLAVWVPVVDELSVTSALLGRGWAVAPGERFRINSAPGIRIGIGTITPEESARLATDMSRCLLSKPRRTD